MKQKIETLLQEMNFACNAVAREKIANALETLPKPHDFNPSKWLPVIKYATEVGGCLHGTEYDYTNAQGNKSTAKVFAYKMIPDNLVNPFLVCFSGYMPAAFCTLDAYQAYKDKYGKTLPLVTIGKGGNKGLYANVFNRAEGIVVETEAEAYMRIMERVLPSEIVREYQHTVADIDTKGNFEELYKLAKEQGLDEVTFILCSGQPWYTKRLLAEGMLEFGKPEYADVKVNLVVLDTPITLDSAFPEGHLSEIMLGYIAASLGPLTKDTCSMEKPDFTKERYLLPGVAEANWSVFAELITNYSNMGWPNYQELLCNVDHETAVYNIIESDLRARASFSPELYDSAAEEEIAKYNNK